MRVLFVLPDMAIGTKGYQVRAHAFARLLSEKHITRVVVARDVSRLPLAWPLYRFMALALAVARNWPLQVFFSDGPDVARRIESIVKSWRPDVVVAVTERVPFTVLRLSTQHLVVLDAVDAMEANMRQRAAASRGLWPMLWRREAEAFRQLSKELTPWFAGIVVSSERERAIYPQAAVISNGAWVSRDARPTPSFDVALTGNLGYWPNIEGVIELCERIVPELRRLMPDVRVVVAGRRPNRTVRTACERAHVPLLADVDDLSSLLRATRIAVAPLRFATGMQLKVLEAIAAGTPALVYPAVARGLPGPLDGVIECADAVELAVRAHSILTGREEVRVKADGVRWELEADKFERLVVSVTSTPRERHVG